MSHAADVPLFVSIVVAVLAVLGASLSFIGSLGLLRLRSFYERVHPPTMGTTMGVALTLLASVVLFSTLESRPVVHEIVIAVFMVFTTPVTFMLLVRAAMHRDRAAGSDPAASPVRADRAD
jgi:multicomponent K+:H+ antiporter subunit G